MYTPTHIAILHYLLDRGEDNALHICKHVRPSGSVSQVLALEQLVAAGDVEGPDLFANYRLSDKAAAQLAAAERRPYEQMRGAAGRLYEVLNPLAKRLEIAGSIRRKRPDIKDVEIVALVKDGQLVDTLRMCAIQILKTGPKYTQVIVRDPEVGPVLVDLFQTEDPEQWGMLLFIRTGCADFVERALTHWKRISDMGYCFENTLRTVTGQIVPTPEEADVFKALKCRFVAPEERVERPAVAPSP